MLKWIFWTWRWYLASITLETCFFFLTPDILLLITSVTTPGTVFSRFRFLFIIFVSWFVLIDLYMSIQSRRSCLVSIIRTLILFFYYSGLLCSIFMELLHWQRGIFCYFSLLWTALKLKNQNKEQFVHVSVFFFYYFIN